jgi:hypothetical protein
MNPSAQGNIDRNPSSPDMLRDHHGPHTADDRAEIINSEGNIPRVPPTLTNARQSN